MPQDATMKQGVRTSELYRTTDLPTRFDRPNTWTYKVKHEHPLYTTTSSMYGSRGPTVHEMPNRFFGQSAKFSELMSGAGPTRNSGFNH